ncbi:MAG: hypothetical protein J6M19_00625 [Bacteroidaceae bacterium]|nr:hypothetical protein [Bacteroidaceae bacterium]
MKTILITLLLCANCTFCMVAQTDDFVYSIKILHEQIEHRDSVLKENLKPRNMIDTMRCQIEDYDALTKSIEKKYDDLVKEVQVYQMLTSLDTIIFYQSFAQYDIPPCLRAHIQLVEKIGMARSAIEHVEKDIDELEHRLGNLDIDKKGIIRKKIEKDVQDIYAMLTDIERMNLESLSDEQKSFIRPGLTGRYNKFSIYFE